MKTLETRGLLGPECELRTEGEGGAIVGYAAVYNQLSEDLGGFRERVLPGAFKQALAGGADVRALVNHDEGLVLGRTKSGTLRLRSTAKGLHATIEPPATGYARDLRESMSRGDVDGMSFAFRAVKDEWRDEEVDGKPTTVREVRQVELYDVSVVTYPAYPQTEVALRSLERHRRRSPERRAGEKRQPEEVPEAPPEELTLEALAARLAALEAWKAEMMEEGDDTEAEEMGLLQAQAEAEAALAEGA